MAQAHKPIDTTAASLMLLLCLIWGAQQSVIKIVADDMSPVLQIALRSGIGMILIGVVMLRQGVSFALHRGPWKPGLLAGCMFAAEFLFIGEGLRLTSASHVVVFLYTSPVFTALGLHFLLPQERLSGMQWMGIGLSFGGVVVAFVSGFLVPEWNADTMLGDLFALSAGVIWGLTTVVLRCTELNRIPATQTTQYQLGSAFIGLVIAAALMGQLEVNWTTAVVSAVLAQGVLVAFFTLLVWFWLLTSYNASQLASFSFLTPIFGVAFGVFLLDEPVSLNFLIGSLMVILGVAIVNHPRARHRA